MVSRKTDEYFMSRALSLARRGERHTAPNPLVGCVFVRDGRVIAEGFHKRYGDDHAEVAAIKNAEKHGENVRGATAYVNLEPCCHYGKTPPCAPRLAEEGVARVVIGMADPNHKVNGGGIAFLKNASVEVSVSCLEEECRWLNRGFIRVQTLGRPWVTLKAAVGFDGRMALLNGESRWISGETSRAWAHLMRASSDAIMVGVGTVLSDDPALTVRHTEGLNPLRVILDSKLSTPLNAKVLSEEGECLILTCSGDKNKIAAFVQAGASVLELPSKDGFIDLEAALKALALRGVRRLMVEGGSRVFSSLMAAGLADDIALFTASKVMGAGIGIGEGLKFNNMTEVINLKNTNVRRVSEDYLLEGRFACSPAL